MEAMPSVDVNALLVRWLENTGSKPSGEEPEVRRRKASLLVILADGPATLPSHLLQLNALLQASPVDLQQVSALIGNDPRLAARLLRLGNSALFGLRQRAKCVEEAALLMGTDRLRDLIFTSHLIQFSCEHLAAPEVESFWRQALVAAMLSERLGRRLNLLGTNLLYLAGLLHDVGKLPMLMAATEENSPAGLCLIRGEMDFRQAEREYFGLDHCEVGRWLGISWNLDPGLVEVIESHHQPFRAQRAPWLVGIVAATVRFCQAMDAGPAPSTGRSIDFYRACLPRLSEARMAAVLTLMRREYLHLRKVLAGEPAIASSAAVERRSHQD
jgi:HD-like signal output (HDOD) protein